jgi:S1-C subfamily serine protease
MYMTNTISKSIVVVIQRVFLVVFLLGVSNRIQAEAFVDVVNRVTNSVVAVGLYSPLAQRGNKILGTGFVVANGNYAITNYHVVSKELDANVVQHYVVVYGKGKSTKAVKADVLGIDPAHDLAILKFAHTLPTLTLASEELIAPGSEIAFTGFPIGAAIGLYPATHRGYISAITPDAIPATNADKLTVDVMKRLRTPELVYQLDATAYPGNSGSAVYLPDSGQVVAVLNKVFVSQGKESALSAPSGISYAIPVKYARELIDKYAR